MLERIVNQLRIDLETERAENRNLLAENRTLRVQVDSVLDRLNDPAADTLSELLDLERKELAGLRVENAELRARLGQEETRSTALYCKHQEFLEWVNKLFRNRTIPMACKLVLLQFWLAISTMRSSATGEEMRIGMQQVADNLGVDVGTVRRATDKAQLFDVLERRYETVKDDAGNTIKLVHITLNDVVNAPDYIEMEKAHGGARVKKCPTCGSEDVDRYTVQYCRDCNENDWYLQPATRNDAPWDKAQKAKNRAPYGKGTKQDAQEIDRCNNDQKSPSPDSMEAQSNGLSTLPSAGLLTTPLAHSPSMESTIKPSVQELCHNSTLPTLIGKKSHASGTSNKKQDAFDQADQKQDALLSDEELAALSVYPFHHEKTPNPAWCGTTGCRGTNLQWIDAIGDWWCPSCLKQQSEPLTD